MQIAHAALPDLARASSKPRWARLCVLLAFLLGGAGTAHAAASCSITAVSVDFGNYEPAFTSPDDSAGTVTVTCSYVGGGSTNVNYVVRISNGSYGTSPTTRQMGAGTARLGYNVFTDPARSQVWGTGTGGTVIASGAMTVGPGVGNGTRTRTHTVYGRIPQLQDAVPGAYIDNLQVTLTF
jgi:spore coat protein U-like protein